MDDDKRMELEAELRALKDLIGQKDNDALEAMDELVVAAAAGSVTTLIKTIIDTLKDFAETCQARIELRAKIREVTAEIESLGTTEA